MNIPIKNVLSAQLRGISSKRGERINVAQMECETLIDLLASVLANGAAYVLRRGLDPRVRAVSRRNGNLAQQN